MVMNKKSRAQKLAELMVRAENCPDRARAQELLRRAASIEGSKE
jgi:hypothetical protein